MHQISALTSGFADATSGTAVLYTRGTLVPATWYTGFDGSGNSTAAVSLDANGSAVVYVNALVDVSVRNSAGVVVRSFTAGADSPNVEVKSNSFTGTDYETALAAAGNPTTLQATLDKWLVSAGTTDFNVLNGSGTASTLQSIAASLTGIVYNVKDAAYGAVGDGSTDDATAIQAAIDAADAAGGGTVFFPPGRFYTETKLNFAKTNTVHILGTSSNQSVIVGLQSLAHVLTLAGPVDANAYVTVGSIGIEHVTASTAPLVESTGTLYSLRMSDVTLGSQVSTNLTANQLLSYGGGRVMLINCSFFVGNNTTGPAVATGNEASVTGCLFDHRGTGSANKPLLQLASSCTATGNTFDGGAATAMTHIVDCAGSYTNVTSNVFLRSAGAPAAVQFTGTAKGCAVGNTMDLTGGIYQADCDTNTLYNQSMGAGRQQSSVASSGTTTVMDPCNYESYSHIRTTGSGNHIVTIVPTYDPPHGTTVTFRFHNTAAIGFTIILDWQGSNINRSANESVATGTDQTHTFMAMDDGAGGQEWVMVGYTVATVWGI